MTERIPKLVLFGAVALIPPALMYLAYSSPGYFTNQTYLVGLVFLECVMAAVWMYRRLFFPTVIVAFLFAGVNLPVGTGWTAARWLVLGVGALVGLLIVLKERGLHFGLFHLVALFGILTCLTSALVSHYPKVALLKVVSLLLLFVYAATGARIAVAGRENRFFAGLLAGCELFVGLNALLYMVGIAAMGNPNSLGAVMGVVAAPILLWGALLGGEPKVNQRRWVLYAICMYLAFHSHARAGMAAALLSCGLLCVSLRKYKLLTEGLLILVALLAAEAILRPGFLSSVASTVVYKNSNQEQGLLASRQSPWQGAVDNIRDHPWFGTGLGTTANGPDAAEERGKFASTGDVTAENGSSYLSILAGVGVLGGVPLFLLLVLLFGKVLRTVTWMRNTGSANHPAVPLAALMVAGFAHAAFEDWMFAPGNYLCVFFWCLAFIFVDVAPMLPLPGFGFRRSLAVPPPAFHGVAPSQ